MTKTKEALRNEAIEYMETMTPQEWHAWQWEYEELGNYISENAHTTEEKQEMFIMEWIDLWNESMVP